MLRFDFGVRRGRVASSRDLLSGSLHCLGLTEDSSRYWCSFRCPWSSRDGARESVADRGARSRTVSDRKQAASVKVQTRFDIAQHAIKAAVLLANDLLCSCWILLRFGPRRPLVTSSPSLLMEHPSTCSGSVAFATWAEASRARDEAAKPRWSTYSASVLGSAVLLFPLSSSSRPRASQRLSKTSPAPSRRPQPTFSTVHQHAFSHRLPIRPPRDGLPLVRSLWPPARRHRPRPTFCR